MIEVYGLMLGRFNCGFDFAFQVGWNGRYVMDAVRVLGDLHHQLVSSIRTSFELQFIPMSLHLKECGM